MNMQVAYLQFTIGHFYLISYPVRHSPINLLTNYPIITTRPAAAGLPY